MKSIIFLFHCLLTVPLFAQSSYPPTFKDARVETYRKIDSTDLKLWIFGESDPKAKKPAIVFFFRRRLEFGFTGPVRESGPAFRKARHDRHHR